MNTQNRPKVIRMKTFSGLLETLGINMYTSIAKSLVEFVANAFDADATEVKITIPFEDIDKARKELRKRNPSNSLEDEFAIMDKTLDKDIKITIEDNGHGMTVHDIEEKFLPIHRDRREGGKKKKSESGNRNVMGRKGIGKLAGFGAAKNITVWSKRKGETYATKIEMDFDQIDADTEIKDIEIKPSYQENVPKDDEGTKISLSLLRGDSFKYTKETIKSRIAQNFSIVGEGFKIYLNGETVEAEPAEYEFCHPNSDGKLGEAVVQIPDGPTYPIFYIVKFRKRVAGEKRSLPARMRGARVYCNKRLAAGPTLFNLHTGMHNFYAQDYMECIVEADELDRGAIDLIGTSRSGIKTDNSIVEAFENKVTELMKEAIAKHSEFRDEVVDKELDDDPTSQFALKSTSTLSAAHRTAVRNFLKALGRTEGVGSPFFKQTVPLFIGAINSGKVLVELIETGENPGNLTEIIKQLRELTEIENRDIVKLYRARQSAIMGLEKLQERVHEKGAPREEKKLHELLKDNPWLINPEYERFITSNKTFTNVAGELTSILKIDAKEVVDSEHEKKRPDLVFVATDPSENNHVCVIELKATNKLLDQYDLLQLEGYMNAVRHFLNRNGETRNCKITGCLIGNLDDNPESLLRSKMRDAGPATGWEVVTPTDLLIRARKVHHAGIKALEESESDEDDADD